MGYGTLIVRYVAKWGSANLPEKISLDMGCRQNGHASKFSSCKNIEIVFEIAGAKL